MTSLSRAGALAVIASLYMAACAAAFVAVRALPPGIELAWQLGIASAAGTLVVFAGSVALDNSSAFDAYWSVAPLATMPWFLALAPRFTARAALASIAVGIWGARLTWNWIRQWRGMGHEDFRYVDIRRSTGRAYWIVSLAGIHLFPALLVWLGSRSLVPAVFSAAPLGPIDIAGFAVALGGALLEAFADQQLRDFVLSPHESGAICDRGLWSWSRNPNYLGELLFWWGLWLLAVGAGAEPKDYVAGPIAITLLFNIVSIPLKEGRMRSRRPAFARYKTRVSRLIPRPPRA